MAQNVLDDVKDFLHDLVSHLTDMHVKAAHVRNTPGDHEALDALTQVPAGLVERAQDLAGKVEKEADNSAHQTRVHVDGKQVAEATAKHAAKHPAKARAHK